MGGGTTVKKLSYLICLSLLFVFLLNTNILFAQIEDDEFDLATISLAIHQFSRTTALAILMELKRISSQILIIDYTSPLPGNLYKPLIQLTERIAGKEHTNNFRAFHKNGGI